MERKQPKYKVIAESLRYRILLREFYPSGRIPSEPQLAKHYKASIGTVRAALALLEQEGMLKRQHGRGTFVTSQTDSGVTSGETRRSLGVIVPDFNDHVSIAIIRVAEQVFSKHGCSLMLACSNQSASKEQETIHQMASCCDGFLIFLTEEVASEEDLKVAQEKGCQIVLAVRNIPHGGFSCVTTDYEEGSYDLVRYLVRKGHRRIGMVIGNKNVGAIEAKRRGVRSAINDFGLPWREEWMAIYPGPLDTPEFLTESLPLLRVIVARLLAYKKGPTALIMGNPWLARGVAIVLREMELSIPKDISLLCFSGSLRVPSPDFLFTGIRCRVTEITRVAAELLVQQCQDSDRTPQTILIPGDFSVGNSCLGDETERVAPSRAERDPALDQFEIDPNLF